MKQTTTTFNDVLTSNLEALDKFQRRTPFHDMVVESIVRVNKRVIITLGEYILILTGVVHWNESIPEFPIVWLYDSIQLTGRTTTLHVDLEDGTIDGEFENLRLIRIKDLAVLIPGIDQG